MLEPSDSRFRKLPAVHYLDDSGTHAASTMAVLGGPVLDRRASFGFQYEWGRLLRTVHGIEGPLHMKEFARPHGRLAYLTNEQRGRLFSDLVGLINDAKAYSLAIVVENLEFQQFFPPSQFKGLFGPSPLAFLWCLFWNHQLVADHYTAINEIGYIVAKSPVDSQMIESHAAFRQFGDGHRLEALTGALDFSTPAVLPALQAADMIAWSNRKHAMGEGLSDGFEPLSKLTVGRAQRRDGSEVTHLHQVVSKAMTQGLAQALSGGEPLKRIGRLELTKWVARGIAPAP